MVKKTHNSGIVHGKATIIKTFKGLVSWVKAIDNIVKKAAGSDSIPGSPYDLLSTSRSDPRSQSQESA